jgi:hypothetical protein
MSSFHDLIQHSPSSTPLGSAEKYRVATKRERPRHLRVPLNVVQPDSIEVVLYQGGREIRLEVAIEGELDRRPEAPVIDRVDIDPDEEDSGGPELVGPAGPSMRSNA